MAVHGLVDKVGRGMINLIFTEKKEKLELVYWSPTNQEAWDWIDKEVKNYIEKLSWEDWPDRILFVFIVYGSAKEIMTLQIGSLIRTIKELPRYNVNFNEKTPDLELEFVNVQTYIPEEDPLKAAKDVEEYVRRNWREYQELKGVIS